jgi:hypothetical protein
MDLRSREFIISWLTPTPHAMILKFTLRFARMVLVSGVGLIILVTSRRWFRSILQGILPSAEL